MTRRKIAENAQSAEWSPDGELIAYGRWLSEEPIQFCYAVVNPDGSNRRLIARLPADRVDGANCPVWSPDSGHLAYQDHGVYPHDDRPWGLWLVDIADAACKRIADGGEHPIWSPDATLLAFGGADAYIVGGSKDNQGLWIIDADGSGLRRINHRRAWPLAWSPDGLRLSYRYDDDLNGIWVINSDGTEDHRIRGDASDDLTLLPKYGWAADDPRPPHGEYRLISPDGQHCLIPMPAVMPATSLPSISAMSRRERRKHMRFQALQESERQKRGGIGIARADGSNPRRLADGFAPAWSPDGRRIAFEAGGNTRRQLWVMDPDGSNQRQLSGDEGLERNIRWSPSGDRIAYLSYKAFRQVGSGFDLWLVEC